MLELTFTVEAEPVPAPRPRVTKRGVYYPKRYTDWIGQVKMAAANLYCHDLRWPVSIAMAFRTKRYRLTDVDNLAKGVMDALTDICWDNDNVVEHLCVRKRAPVQDEKEGVTVTIRARENTKRSLT